MMQLNRTYYTTATPSRASVFSLCQHWYVAVGRVGAFMVADTSLFPDVLNLTPGIPVGGHGMALVGIEAMTIGSEYDANIIDDTAHCGKRRASW